MKIVLYSLLVLALMCGPMSLQAQTLEKPTRPIALHYDLFFRPASFVQCASLERAMSRRSTLGLGVTYTEGGTGLFTRSWNGQTGDTRYQTHGLMLIGKVYAFLNPDKKARSGPYFRFDLSGLRMRDQFLVHGTSTVISDNHNLGMSIGVGFGYTLQINQRLLLDGGARFAFTYFPSAVASDDFDHSNAGRMFGNDLARIWLGVGVLLSR